MFDIIVLVKVHSLIKYFAFQASARRVGLKKLLDWILSVMALSLVPWRLVIGDNNSPTLSHHYDFPSLGLNDPSTTVSVGLVMGNSL